MPRRNKLTPPSLEQVNLTLYRLCKLSEEGMIHLEDIEFDESLIDSLHLENLYRSRTRHMQQIRNSAKTLSHSGKVQGKSYTEIVKPQRPSPEKYLNARRVFCKFLETEGKSERLLRSYLEKRDVGDESQWIDYQRELFRLGYSPEDLEVFDIEKPLTHFSDQVFKKRPVLNQTAGLIGLSFSINSSIHSILGSEIYYDACTDKARAVFDAAASLYHLVQKYHSRRQKAA